MQKFYRSRKIYMQSNKIKIKIKTKLNNSASKYILVYRTDQSQITTDTTQEKLQEPM